eukprot:769738-Prorocentrum_minimum.AAC.7
MATESCVLPYVSRCNIRMGTAGSVERHGRCSAYIMTGNSVRIRYRQQSVRALPNIVRRGLGMVACAVLGTTSTTYALGIFANVDTPPHCT